MIHYHAQFQDPVLTDPSVASTLNVRASTMLLLPIVGNLKVQCWVDSNGIIFIPFS
jgi:hypothetical protein